MPIGPREKYEQYKGPRYQLVGPKVQVIKVEKGVNGIRIYAKLYGAHPIILTFDAPVADADVRVGEDWLTLYTEIAVKPRN